MIPTYKEKQMATDWGYEIVLVCETCSCIVYNEVIHTEWHQAIIAALDKNKDSV